MKGIVCKKCGCAKWWVRWVKQKDGLRLRRLKCRNKNCGSLIFTEEKEIFFDPRYTGVTQRGNDAGNNSADC